MEQYVNIQVEIFWTVIGTVLRGAVSYYNTTRCHNPEDRDLNLHHCENPKSRIYK